MFFETTIDGVTWYQLPMTPVDGSSAVVTAAAPGIWRAEIVGLSLVRARLGGTVTGAVIVMGVGS